MAARTYPISLAAARGAWLSAQKLDEDAPFGEGPEAVRRAVEHLGYVQIDTINVIERSHHHILQTRIPSYRTSDLEAAQSVDKSVFEYWTHALAYVPAADYRFFVPAMDRVRSAPEKMFASDPGEDYAALLRRISKNGPLSIRDIDDDVLVDKTHPWGSRKPSKRALRFGFFAGDLTVGRRTGMLKTYDLTKRHFGWRRRPAPATDKQYASYLLARAVRSQGVVSLDSICYGDLPTKRLVAEAIETEVKRKRLASISLEGAKTPYWAPVSVIETGAVAEPDRERVHILSPFDPLVVQRKRLKTFFGHEHRFEAYVPAEKRVLGYFALPVLAGDRIVAAIDLKMDRKARRLLIQKWTWFGEPDAGLKAAIDQALERFERFQSGEAA
jgi:uncharacterized protein YcaQ